MKHILAKTHRPLLERFATSQVLLGFDYDGTLAPIIPNPARVRMRGRTRRLLKLVAERYPCVVISGRSRDDVLARVDDIPVVEVVGNHGLEPDCDVRGVVAKVRPWIRHLHQQLDGMGGVVIENKRLSIAVHYRRSRQRDRARSAIMDAVLALGSDVRIVSGECSIDLLPEGFPNKGVALRRLCRGVAERAIYVGDDVTDEDVFALRGPQPLLSIRVGRKATSAASYYLRRQSEVDDLLEVLVRLRDEPIRSHDSSPDPKTAGAVRP